MADISEPICLSKMETLLRSEKIIALGKKLVLELRYDRDANDYILGRWMAHYLAELLVKAEETSGAEQASICQQCANLILKLWESRATLPMSKIPFSSFDEITTALGRLDNSLSHYNSNIKEKNDSKLVVEWLNKAEKINLASKRLIKSCLMLALKEAIVEENDWMDVMVPQIDEKISAQTFVRSINYDEFGLINSSDGSLAQYFREFGEWCIELSLTDDIKLKPLLEKE